MYAVIEIDTSTSRYGACCLHIPYLHMAHVAFSYEKALIWARDHYGSKMTWDILKVGE